MERAVGGGERGKVAGVPVDLLVAFFAAKSGSSQVPFNLDRCLASQVVAMGLIGGEKVVRRR